VLLQTAVAPVCCGDGSVISARILLDSASQRTFMTDQMAKLLKLPSQRKFQFVHLDLKVLRDLCRSFQHYYQGWDTTEPTS